ncbi:hypothetical protein OO256_14135 [Pseudomonas sp. DCB_CB]|uniref:hypothetical protein n=1 Tax=Pseudomonas TaxID=286 RepID=UPI000FFBB435|nr:MULTISPECIES: hypothetical protein [Pseudomonas]MCX2691890.1 hypothetical protein [Pseudomonas sp. DCB_BZ]MCX2857231.1 hypothetical protein [Pseudomonas sp. DCB_CB]UZM95227.1 hypothetical protein OPZ46_07335 [Pseudomonas putida DOT-T1E]WPO32138.1 hypothetical protein REH59_10965 [Pseudomonas sp. BO3-4]
MSLTKPNQELRRDLQGLASDLKWSVVELKRIAERISLSGNDADAQALLRMCRSFKDGEERLTGYAEETHLGLIVRVKNPCEALGSTEIVTR